MKIKRNIKMVKLNGNKENAKIRELAKRRLIPVIAGAMVMFNINKKQLSIISGVNYNSLRNGMSDPSKLSVETFEEIKANLFDYIKETYKGVTSYKLLKIEEALENDE